LTVPPARRPRRSGGLTGRALMLGTVLVLMALVLASPLQRYLQQRSALNQAEQTYRETTARVAQLGQQLAQWNDPAFVERQARARLQFARPGDTVYVVLLPGAKSADASSEQVKPVVPASGKASWQTKAWTSLQVADAPP
jgi:cell division protein FtsB